MAEGLPVDAVVALLSGAGTGRGARLLEAMAPYAARSALAALPARDAAALVAELAVPVAAALLRGLSSEARSSILGELPRGRARTLESLLRFPEGSAGALMDPEVLGLPEDLTAVEAVERVRQAAHAARYNLYVLDREQHLVGVVNQRELLLAPRRATLGSFMTRRVHRLPAGADPVAVVRHPAWREVHSLPVVDENGVYVGAIRYRVFRALEEAVRGRPGERSVTAEALGDLFRTGASALLEMLSTPPPTAGAIPDGR